MSTPAVLDGEQRALLTAVLERIIPQSPEMPGAGDLGVTASIERALATASPLRRLFLDGLVEIELASARQNERGFRDLGPDEQDAVLRAVEEAQPTFFSALVDHTYRGYYTDPRVHEAIGFESRPPQPLGHQLPPFDPELLARQRQRAPFWRETS